MSLEYQLHGESLYFGENLVVVALYIYYSGTSLQRPHSLGHKSWPL